MKKSKPIITTTKDFDLLKRIISLAQHDKNKSYKAAITRLKNEMDMARIVPEQEMPKNIIRFNSFVKLKTPFLTREYQLVTPDHSDLSSNKLSILAPMGLALFGYAKDDEIVWEFPTGPGTIKIIDVRQ